MLNEEANLGRLLESLLKQSYSPEEIVLADGGSTDGTVAIAHRFQRFGVRTLKIGPAYPGRGRNEAIKAARNDWIALIDAGCVADGTWLENLVRPACEKEVPVVYGQMIPRLETEWEVAQALSFVGLVDPKTGCRPPFIASSLIHRSAWMAVGGFPENLRAAEDLLFFDRLEAAGISTTRSAEAIVYWNLSSGPGDVFRRFRLYSAHHFAAGLWRRWHLRVFTMDTAAVFLAWAALFWPAAMVFLLGAGSARLLRTVFQRRGNITNGSPFRVDRMARVAVLLFLADVAAWIGGLDYLLGREHHTRSVACH